MPFWEQSVCALVVGGLVAVLSLATDQTFGTDTGRIFPRVEVCWSDDC